MSGTQNPWLNWMSASPSRPSWHGGRLVGLVGARVTARRGEGEGSLVGHAVPLLVELGGVFLGEATELPETQLVMGGEAPHAGCSKRSPLRTVLGPAFAASSWWRPRYRNLGVAGVSYGLRRAAAMAGGRPAPSISVASMPPEPSMSFSMPVFGSSVMYCMSDIAAAAA
jgi:hypothetical protein